MGGDCWVESIEGSGSTFQLSITVQKDANHTRAPIMTRAKATTPRAVIYAKPGYFTTALCGNLTAFGIGYQAYETFDEANEYADVILLDITGTLEESQSKISELREKRRNAKVSTIHGLYRSAIHI